MNARASMIKGSLIAALTAGLVLVQAPVFAAEGDETAEALAAEQEELRRIREEMLAALEESRLEAERAAEEARIKAEKLRQEAERMRREADRAMHEAGEQRSERMREIDQARRELSRTHRELRRASQDVARAHRELALTEDRRIRTRLINLGDRAMIGVILGESTDEGIEVIGVSPDGPAERAGLQTGDVLVSLRGTSLAAADGREARDIIFNAMSEVGDGEEIAVTVLRDGKRWDFMVKPEKREPASWASFIRLPDPPPAPAMAEKPPLPPPAPHVMLERIAVPPIDVTELAAEAEALAEEFESLGALYEFGDFNFEFDSEELSELGTMALREANVVFGTPATRGVRFTELNQGLGEYFDTDHGVLVLVAPEDNPLGLEPGDVVLGIGDSEVNTISDIFRALRAYEAGDEVAIAVKRRKRNESITVTMPKNRLGMFDHRLIRGGPHAAKRREIAED